MKLYQTRPPALQHSGFFVPSPNLITTFLSPLTYKYMFRRPSLELELENQKIGFFNVRQKSENQETISEF